MKRYLSLITVVFLLAVTLFIGCQAEEDTKTTQEPSAKETTIAADSQETEKEQESSVANTFPIVDTPVTLTCLGLDMRSEIEDFDTNAVTKYWEEKTGVHIDMELVKGDGSQEKLSVVMASGNLPDIIQSAGFTFTTEMVTSYGAQGLVIPLNDFADEYGVNLKNLFEYDDKAESGMTSPDGNIYFMPRYFSYAKSHVSTMGKCLVNTQWLDTLGLDVPTTTDEFYDMLVAFRDNDANGNGDMDDEIPLAGTTDYIDGFLMNSFEYNSFNEGLWMMIEDGKIESCCTKDGFQEGLRYLRKLYAEDLMDKEIFLADRSQLKLYSGDEKGNRIGSIQSYAYSAFLDIQTDIVNEFAFIEPLVGPTGLQQTPYSPDARIYVDFVITKDCEIPEVAFRWADAHLADAMEDVELLNGVYGPEGEGWARAEEGEVGLDGQTPALYKWLFTWGEPNNLNYHEWGMAFNNADWKLLMVSSQDGWDQETELCKATLDLYHPYGVQKNVPRTLMFDESEAAEISGIRANYKSYIKESLSKFITGSMDVDEDWDAFKKELDNIGLPRMLELYQTAYDRQFAN